MNIDWTLIATFLTALATLMTVLEMKKQRQQSNLPNIVLLPDKRFYLYKGTSQGNYQYWYWHEKNLDEIEQVETITHYKFDVDLFNIGMGSAKNINFIYKINANEMKLFLNNLGALSIDIMDFENAVLNFSAKYGTDTIGTSLGKEDLIFSHIFIPKSDEKPFNLRLPQIYLALFNAFLLSILNKNNYRDFFDQFPPIQLSISYTDITNNKYKKQFKLKLKIDGAVINTNRAPSHVSGIIKINEYEFS